MKFKLNSSRKALSVICATIGICATASTADTATTADVAIDNSATADTIEVLTAKKLFITAPTSVFPTIDPMTRMDMIDYFLAATGKASKNLIGGECQILEVTPEILTVKTSSASEYTVSLLPTADGTKIVMLIRTLKTPAEDSTVTFYNTEWQKINTLLTIPTLQDWILPEAKKKLDDIENAMPFVMATLRYNPTDLTATFSINPADYLPTESLEIVNSSIRKSLTYKWNGKRFIIIK